MFIVLPRATHEGGQIDEEIHAVAHEVVYDEDATAQAIEVMVESADLVGCGRVISSRS